MWNLVSIFILRHRIAVLLGLLVATAYMGYRAKDAKISYDFAKVVPSENVELAEYQRFREHFGEDANIMVIGISTSRLFKLNFFNDWMALGDTLEGIHGIDGILSVPRVLTVTKTADRKMQMQRLFEEPPKSQSELDSLRRIFEQLPFYEGLLYDKESNASILALTFNKEQLDSKERIGIVEEIRELTDAFGKKHNTELYYSGLPFIRTHTVTAISTELKRFLLMAMGILAILLFLLFRTVYAVIFPMIVVIIGAIWSLGTIAMLGYKITLLTGLIPTLIVVIGIPNCIYLLNKYHAEYKKHGNKQKALMRTLERIGKATLFTNLTTAIGFGVFYFTDIDVLTEFGLVAFIDIAAIFLISLVGIPIVFSFLPEPKNRHIVHLDRKTLNKVLDWFQYWTTERRKLVFGMTFVLVGAAAFGLVKLKSRGYMLDDVPKASKLYQDLLFFEKNFDGVLPFEVMVESDQKVTNPSFLKKLERLQDSLASNAAFGRPVSVVDAVKFATQAYYNGNASRYRLPSGLELRNPGLMRFLASAPVDAGQQQAFVDTSGTRARISMRMANIGSDSMPKLLAQLRKHAEEIYPDSGTTVTFTGTSLLALEGYGYLIDGLINSVGLALLLIALIMAYLFRNIRMLALALIPNLIPLAVTAGLMGYLDIPLKPSTVLIFSVAFGISVDYTIHFLAKYRQELSRHRWDVRFTVQESLRETGVSMIYTSLILLFGFIIFTFSEFEGTVNLGRLTSITLVVALFCNLVLLPAILIQFGKSVNPASPEVKKQGTRLNGDPETSFPIHDDQESTLSGDRSPRST